MSKPVSEPVSEPASRDGKTPYTFYPSFSMLSGVQILLTLFSAVLLPLALPNEVFPWGAMLPGVVALVPALLAVYHARTWREAARLGALFGAISTAIGNYWLAFFGEFSIWTIGGAVIGYTGYNYILFGYLFHFSRLSSLRSWRRPLQIAVVWTAYEYLKSVGFLGYPWGLIAYPFAVWNPLAQGAEFAGVWGLSFIGAWTNASIAELLYRRGTPPPDSIPSSVPGCDDSSARLTGALHHLASVILVITVVVVFGFYRLYELRPRLDARSDAGNELQVLLVQQNVDSWEPGRFSDALAQAQTLTLDALREHEDSGGAPVDFVVWSETALRRPYLEDERFYDEAPAYLPFRAFLAAIDLPLISGSPMPADTGGRDLTNSAVVLRSDGSIIDSYAKQQLVPFAELIPFWEFSSVRDFFRDIVGIYGTWLPGDRSTVISVPLNRPGRPALRVGLPICFEDGFGWVPRELVRNGASVLVNLTNNSWSRQDSAQTQHYVAARLRAIELRTPLVRGTNSGLTGVVDPRGILTGELPMFKSTAAVVPVRLHDPSWTLYRAIGDFPGQLAVIYVLSVVVISSGILRRRS